MDKPAANPEGYEVSKVLNYVKDYPTDYAVRRSFAAAQDDRTAAQDDRTGAQDDRKGEG